jgi:hypothetical protein
MMPLIAPFRWKESFAFLGVGLVGYILWGLRSFPQLIVVIPR